MILRNLDWVKAGILLGLMLLIWGFIKDYPRLKLTGAMIQFLSIWSSIFKDHL